MHQEPKQAKCSKRYFYPHFEIADLERNLAECDESINHIENVLFREERRRRELIRLIALCREQEQKKGGAYGPDKDQEAEL